MKKTVLLIWVALITVSCDLLFNRDSDSTPPTEDIAVSAVNASPSVIKGEIATVEVTVKNSGNLNINEGIEITLSDITEEVQIGTQVIEDGLARNDSVILNYNWNTGSSEVGDHTIVASHNYNDDNNDNDSLMSALKINAPDITDLAISTIIVPDMVDKGKVVDVEVILKNVGNQDVAEEVTVTLNDDTDGTIIAKQTFSEGIATNDSTTLIFNWSTSEASIGNHTLTASHEFSDENSANDARTKSITVNEAPVPDIAIISLEVPEEATQGDEVNISFTIENIGTKDAQEDFEVILTDQTDGNELARQAITDGLAVGDKIVISLIWDTDGASIGEHTLESRHSFNDENKSNDTKTAGMIINEVPVTDIAITEVNAEPTSTYQGEKEVTVSVTVKNMGNQEVENPLEVTLTDKTDGKTIETKTINNLPSGGESETFTFNWGTENASVGDHELVVEHNLNDDDNTNNSGSVTVFVDEPPFIDLELISISAPSSATMGDTVTVTARVQNRGNRNVDQPIDIKLTDDTDGTTISIITIGEGLVEGESKNVSFEWDTKDESLGEHKLTASHDLDDDNSSNDSRSLTVTIIEPIFFDIAVTDIEADDRVERGDFVDIKVTLKNQGNRDVNSDITVTLRNERTGSTIGTQFIRGGLEEGKSTSRTFSWFTIGAPPGNHTLIATHDFDDDEDSNNSLSKDIFIEND